MDTGIGYFYSATACFGEFIPSHSSVEDGTSRRHLHRWGIDRPEECAVVGKEVARGRKALILCSDGV